jgi:CRP-like cAMP-binding protein
LIEYANIRKNSSKKRPSDAYIDKVLSNMPDSIKKQARFIKMKKDEIIIHQSDQVKYAYITVNGEISVINEFESGKLFEPVIIPHSDFIGVVEIILGHSEFISSNVAKTDVELIRIPTKVFQEWISMSHETTTLVLESVCRNFVKNMSESGETMILDSMYLLVRHLLMTSSYDREKKQYTLQETREKTSIRTGVNLRTLYRHIKKLKEDGYCSSLYRGIVFNEGQKAALYDYYLLLRNK